MRHILKTTEYLNSRRKELNLSGYFYAHLHTCSPAWTGKPKKNRGERNLKNDVKKVNEITTEMRVNDLIYKIIDDELEDMIYDCDELDEEFEKLYFAKRVLSVFQNNDMPIRAAVGLLDNVDIIEALYEDKDEYIGDSDSDTDIWNYVVEHGYRHYDEIVLPGECPEMVYLRIARCILKKGEYAYDE